MERTYSWPNVMRILCLGALMLAPNLALAGDSVLSNLPPKPVEQLLKARNALHRGETPGNELGLADTVVIDQDEPRLALTTLFDVGDSRKPGRKGKKSPGAKRGRKTRMKAAKKGSRTGR